MITEIQSTKNEAIAQIVEASDIQELETVKTVYLGKRGKLRTLTNKIKGLNKEQRKYAGALINEAKKAILVSLEGEKNRLKNSSRAWFDPTFPGESPAQGSLHLVTQAIEEITRIFQGIGFTRARYPEVEWDYYAFESLNMPSSHPARDEWETFFVRAKSHPKYGDMVLTPHTSSGQVREMETRRKPPIRMINLAKCYRRQSDASHFPMFHQFEGLVIDERINIANLKGTLDHFARNYYGAGIKTRLRPYHFAFTEPSFEVDVTCSLCQGRGCKVCGNGWLELGGAGMVHPKVLTAGKIDPKKFTGFAFGWGVERVLMMRPNLNIPDLRILYSSRLDYLKQF